MFAAGGAAGVGYGVPAALATQMIRPDNRVVCVAGDSGMMMHLYTLEMARQFFDKVLMRGYRYRLKEFS